MDIAQTVLDGLQVGMLGYLVWRTNLTYWDGHEVAVAFRERREARQRRDYQR